MKTGAKTKAAPKNPDVPIGARVPKGLKDQINRFCLEHGLKMSHFVKTALQDKLGEMEEELNDIAMARERLADSDFLSREEYDRYIQKRLAKK